MREIVGASSQPGVISAPAGEKPVIALSLLVQEGSSTQPMEFRLTELGAAALIRVLQKALDQTSIVQKTPGRLQ